MSTRRLTDRVESSHVKQFRNHVVASKNGSLARISCRTRHRRNLNAQFAILAEVHHFDYHHFLGELMNTETPRSLCFLYEKLYEMILVAYYSQ